MKDEIKVTEIKIYRMIVRCGFEFDTEMVFKKELSKLWTKKRMNEFKLNYKKRYSQKIYFTYEEKS